QKLGEVHHLAQILAACLLRKETSSGAAQRILKSFAELIVLLSTNTANPTEAQAREQKVDALAAAIRGSAQNGLKLGCTQHRKRRDAPLRVCGAVLSRTLERPVRLPL